MHAGKEFTVVTEGKVARALSRTFGADKVGFTPAMVREIVTIVAILSIAAVLLYALSKGYKVTGKVTDTNGNEYEIEFEPKKRKS